VQWWFQTRKQSQIKACESQRVREEEEEECVPHADGRGDGVADGDADEVDVLRQRAQPVLGNP